MAQTVSKDNAFQILMKNDDRISEMQAKALLQGAADIKSRAYCPYSKFRVGAAVLTTSSTGTNTEGQSLELFTGVNVENASYPVGVCGERCAIGTAVAAGYPRVVALAVSTDIDPPASPCGMCRQFIREFVDNKDVLVIMMGKQSELDDGRVLVYKFSDLLPMSFGPEQLPSPSEVSR